MKKTLLYLILLLLPMIALAQTPQTMSYQAVVRNSTNELLTNQTIGIQISILQGSENGNIVYQETHKPTSNQSGLIGIKIGGGTIIAGTFSELNWGDNAFFIKTEIDPDGNENYTITGTNQFMTVPYALYAETSGSSQGIQGIQGDKGDTGDKGDQGIQGIQGIQGDKGDTGVKGDQGIQGIQGDKGDAGDKGDQGIQGIQGDKGDAGDKGDQGIQGIQGDKGDTGDKGDQGIQGIQGIQGNKGDTGGKGDQGIQGIQGDKGDAGDKGDQGIQGIQGDKGDAGDQGDQGIQGIQGDKGDTGVKGDQGIQGIQGDKGDAGDKGDQGIQGIQGDKGDAGDKGDQGIQGIQGIKGDTGGKGDQGAAGVGIAQTLSFTSPNLGLSDGGGSIDLTGINATHTGDVVGATALTITTNAVTTNKIKDNNVTDAKIATVSASKLIGVVGTANGGTNITTYTQGAILYATSATELTKLPKGTAGQVLTMNSGATAPEWVDVAAAAAKTYTVNTFYAELGGYVIEINTDGTHGLVVAMQDQGSSNWYEANDLLSNAANHDANGAKFKDWRIPTKRELNLMYGVTNGNGAGLISGYYWSSTESAFNSAWGQDFGFFGEQYGFNKYDSYTVRAVRAF
jgi:hypothetical protein